MPTKKIGELPKGCSSPAHDPPMHMHFSLGVYEHECPRCHTKVVFTVLMKDICRVGRICKDGRKVTLTVHDGGDVTITVGEQSVRCPSGALQGLLRSVGAEIGCYDEG
jgi:hypothetical protein